MILVPAGAIAATTPCNPQIVAVAKETGRELQHRVSGVLDHLRHLIADNSQLGPGGCKTYEAVDNGIVRKVTLCLASDGVTYSYELDESVAGGSLVKVTTATVKTTTDATNITETIGTVSIDYDALASVIPAESARGQISAAVDYVKDPSKPFPGEKNMQTITFTNFLPEESNPHGPQTGTYTHLGEPGIGSLSTLVDALIMLCPANPTEQVANIAAVDRDFITYAGAKRVVHARSDGKMTGGQLPAGDAFMKVACATTEVGTYEMSKLEDASGNTISGSVDENGTGLACDPSFGAVPSLINNATDYNFSAAVSFPNEW
jgi:hypothetical protein